MTRPKSITGAITAMVTPFDKSNQLNTTVLNELVCVQVAAGADGIMVSGGSGEYVNLNQTEREQLIRSAAKASGGHIPVVAGILEPSTMRALDAIKSAENAGADAIMLMTPYYLNPTEEGIYAHFETAAATASVPIILYNNPGRTQINMSANLLQKLGQLENIIGIKECDRDPGRVSSKIEATKGHLDFLAGDDDLLLPMLVLGARGAVMATSNLAPTWGKELLQAFREGNLETCRELHSRLTRLLSLFYRANHPGPLKEALNIQGWDVGLARAPLMRLTAPERDELAKGLAALGIEHRL